MGIVQGTNTVKVRLVLQQRGLCQLGLIHSLMTVMERSLESHFQTNGRYCIRSKPIVVEGNKNRGEAHDRPLGTKWAGFEPNVKVHDIRVKSARD